MAKVSQNAIGRNGTYDPKLDFMMNPNIVPKGGYAPADFFPDAPKMQPGVKYGDMTVAGPWGAGIPQNAQGGGPAPTAKEKKEIAAGAKLPDPKKDPYVPTPKAAPAPVAASPLADPKKDPYVPTPAPTAPAPTPTQPVPPALPNNPFGAAGAMAGLGNPFGATDPLLGSAGGGMTGTQFNPVVAALIARAMHNPSGDPMNNPQQLNNGYRPTTILNGSGGAVGAGGPGLSGAGALGAGGPVVGGGRPVIDINKLLGGG
jgi:hypothetical protein